MRQNRAGSLLTGFVIGLGLMTLLSATAPAIRGLRAAIRTEYRATIEASVDTELVFVFIGSPDCSFSTSKPMKPAVRSLKLAAANMAAEQGIPFRTIGVSVNRDSPRGLEFLSEFGQFDEVTAGGYFDNTAARRFFYGDDPGVASTPQVLLLRREVESDAPPGLFTERVLVRLAGAGNVFAQAAAGGFPKEAGAPVPDGQAEGGTLR